MARLLLLILLIPLFRLVSDVPVEPAVLAGHVRLDALSAWFITLIGAATLLHKDRTVGRRRWASASALFLAVLLTSLPGIAVAFAIAVLLEYLPLGADRPDYRRLALPIALAAVAALALAAFSIGNDAAAWRYNDPVAGLGLNSPAFALILCATLQSLLDELFPAERPFAPLILRLAWFYPLLRLYSLGPWNTGWLLATLLLGSGLAITAAWRALADTEHRRRGAHLAGFSLGLALAGAGLGSAAGLAAAAYALLSALLLHTALARPAADPPDELLAALLRNVAPVAPPPAQHPRRYLPWLLAPVLPFSTPFVATWMAMAAAASGGLPALAMLLWGAGLLSGLAFLQGFLGSDWPATRRLHGLALTSLGLGLAAPLVLRFALQPLAEQLAGGLSPLGDIRIWPWAGMLALDSAARTWAALPSLALIAVLLINAALVWLAWRFGEALER